MNKQVLRILEISGISNNCFVGEAVDIIFKALLIVTKSRCNGRGGSLLSQHTDVFGEDLNAPVHNLNPRV